MGSYEVVDKMDCLKIGSIQIDYNLNIIFFVKISIYYFFCQFYGNRSESSL